MVPNDRQRASLQSTARIAGALYAMYFPTAVASGLLVKGIVVPQNAAATATNILAHESLLRSGWAVGLLSTILYIALLALFYELFLRVSRTVSIFAALAGLVGCAVQAAGSIFQLAPLLILKSSSWFAAFPPGQREALALLLCKLHSQASGVEIVFFGIYDVALGYLVFRSLYLPRWLGLLMGVAGIGWLTALAPMLSGYLSPSIQILGFLAEVALMFWLLIKGVNIQPSVEPYKAV